MFILFTQLSSASLFSSKYCCRVGPNPFGPANCLTKAFVFSSCCGVTIGSRTLKYSAIVSSKLGKGTFGRSCKKKKIEQINTGKKQINQYIIPFPVPIPNRLTISPCRQNTIFCPKIYMS